MWTTLRPLIFCVALLIAGRASAQLQFVQASGRPVTDVFMINSTVGYAGGGDGILKTTDGGSTWTQLPRFVLPADFIELINSYPFTYMVRHHLFFSDANNGISVGWNSFSNREEIVKTTDGGATWTIVHDFNPNTAPFQTPAPGLCEVIRQSSGLMITVGGFGRVLVSSDNGSTWAAKTTNTQKDLSDVASFGPSNIIAVGDGVIVKSVDGGVTWAATTSDYEWSSVEMISATEAIGATGSGALFRSTDVGQTWQPILQVDQGISEITFLNDQVGYISASSILLKTTDGGQTFEKFAVENYSPYAVGLQGVCVLSENNFFVPTYYGQIGHTMNGHTFIPVSHFNAPVIQTCNNSSAPLTFTNLGKPSWTYRWLVDKQVVNTTFNLSQLFPLAGARNVSLVSENANGRDTATVSVYVNKLPDLPAELNFGFPKDTVEFLGSIPSMYGNVYGAYPGAKYKLFVNDVAVSDWVSTYPINTDRLEFIFPPINAAGVYNFVVKGELPNECGIGRSEDGFKTAYIAESIRPKYVHVEHEANNSALITWGDNSQHETDFVIQRKRDDETDFQVVGTAASQFPTGYLDGPLQPGHTYHYRVAARNAAGTGRPSLAVSLFIYNGIIYVNKNANGANNGYSWANAFEDPKDAFAAVDATTEVWMAKGAYGAETNDGYIVNKTKGIYGGFNGTETQLSQRNVVANKTIISAEKGSPGDVTDGYAHAITIWNGSINGFTITGASASAVVGALVENCILEYNRTGSEYGIVRNSLIRNNWWGVDAYQADPTVDIVSNSIIYNNMAGTFYDSNYGTNCLFFNNNYSEPVEFSNRNTLTKKAKRTVGGKIITTTLSYEYLAGDDRILGNDDDIFHFPRPAFIDNGKNDVILATKGADVDFDGNPRIRNGVVDFGPIEYIPDAFPTPPPVQVSEPTNGHITIQWPAITDASVTKIWLERTSTRSSYMVNIERDEEQKLFYFDKNTTSYVDINISEDTQYTYALRLQRGRQISLPGESDISVTKYQQTIEPIGNKVVEFVMQTITLPQKTSQGNPVVYESADESIISINGNIANINKTGTVTITASSPGNGIFDPAPRQSFTITVKRKSQYFENILDIHQKIQPKTGLVFDWNIYSTSGVNVEIKSSNENIAKVEGHVVTFLAIGDVILTVGNNGNEDYEPLFIDIPKYVNQGQSQLTFSEVPDFITGTNYVFDGQTNSGRSIVYHIGGPTGSFETSDASIAQTLPPGTYTVYLVEYGDANWSTNATESQTFCVRPSKPTIIVDLTDPSKPVLSAGTDIYSWYLDGVLLGTHTGVQIATVSGNYKAEVSDTFAGCSSDMSEGVNVVVGSVVTGIEEQPVPLQLYPNPASDVVVIKGITMEDRLTLINMLGVTMNLPATYSTSGAEINITSLSAGTYIVVLERSKSKRYLKFIK